MKLTDSMKVALPLVTSKDKHRDYEFVVTLAKDVYRPMATAENADHLITQFQPREDEKAIEQRRRLTHLTTPAVINTVMGPARKVPRVKPVVNVATFGDKAIKENELLTEATDKFYSGQNVDHYFGTILLDQGAIDPNSFCLVLFNDFDSRKEKPRVYPSLIGCEDAWNYLYLNGELQWLWVHRDIKYVEIQMAPPGEKKKRGEVTGEKPTEVVLEGHAFWLYTDLHNVMFTQVDSQRVKTKTENVVVDAGGKRITNFDKNITLAAADTYYYRVSPTELYEVRFYEHKAGIVQAFRLGYIPDQRTMGRTMVTLYHPAMPFLKKGIKSGSELDLCAALHVFLQKISHAPECRGYRDEQGTHTDCDRGWIPGGNKKCLACNGSGFEVHLSAQDHIILAMPQSKEEMLELVNLVHYVDMPTAVLEWLDKYVDKLEEKCYRAVYNSDRFRDTNSTGTVTATGDIIDLQSVYDALSPCAAWYAMNRVLVYTLTASFVVGSELTRTDFVCAFQFPKNMRFETLGERVLLLEKLRAAGMGTESMEQVEEDVMDDLYTDNPEALKKQKVIRSFNPYKGKTEATAVTMISQDLTPRRLKVFWTNSAWIFAQAEREVKNTKDADGRPVLLNFYDMERDKQEEILEKITDDLIKEIDEDGEAAMEKAKLGMNPDGGDPNNPDNPDANPDPNASKGGNDLPNSPGNKATK